MDQQLSFSDSEFSQKRRRTRREIFLERMEVLIPWKRLEAVIEPYYPKRFHGIRTSILSRTISLRVLRRFWLNSLSEKESCCSMTTSAQAAEIIIS